MKATLANRRSPPGFIGLMSLAAIASGAGYFSQWRESVRLRTERDLGHLEVREWERLCAENGRLRQGKISAAELHSLRADHEALARLRAEVDALTRSAFETR